MIDIHELTSGSLSCPVSLMASPLLSFSLSYDAFKCSLPNTSQALSPSPFLAPSSSPSLSSSFFSRQEPLLFCSFDLNPNTSTFTVTFLTALVLQLTGFFLIKKYLPQVANPQTNRQNRRALSWILSLFSSIILFTGTFTLSSEIEWSIPGNALEREEPFYLVASMHRFPRESGLATAYCAYFVSYLICDLGLGMVYYPDFVDPLSGWAHHLFYLGIMSLATAQGNISTLFAMGTPIEVSTIFLATGHIFPTLRSDVVFATSFLFARILYPIALLPELILNVESRLCWKVGAMALSVHVYWFYKFIQQQLRYYHARQEQKQQLNVAADVKVDGQSTTATVAREEESLKIQTVSEDRKSTGIVCESGIAAAVTVDKSVEAKTPESPTAANEMFGTGLSAIPSIQVNSSRHRRPRVVRLPSGQSIASLASFQPPTEDSDNAATPAVTITPPAITISSSATIVTAAAVTAVTTPTTKKAPKTMKELLEECSDEDISTYKFPIHSNKTLSVLARKPSNDSQGIFGSGRDLGVVRLSRASSMRDSKRRIALGAVQFACPSSSSSSLTVGEPKANKEEEEPCSVKNGEVEAVEGLKKNKTMNRNVDADATVVMRPRRASPSRDGDYGFGTVRGGVVAVNA